MLLFLDTEFTGLDQPKPDLISIALVDETGRDFYAELPESNWTVQCNEWVHFNVVPHLWRGDYVHSAAVIGERITAWIESMAEKAVIITDYPDVDFFAQLRPLLSRWPKNLHSWPMQFSAWSMGDAMQPVLQNRLDDYHSPERPAHHALHDAHALRLCMMFARERGWHPGYEEKE